MRISVVALAVGPFVVAGGARSRTAPTQLDCPTIAAPINTAPTAPCGFQCGTERWSVKTLTDRDAGQVDFTPFHTTVTQLGKLPVPKRRPDDRRAGSAERRVYCVDALMVDFRAEKDGDIHMVVAGIEDTTSRLIVEFPDVRCATVCASRYAPAIAAARQAMEQKLATFKTNRLRVRIVGVGFFDRNHGQNGAAPNFFELHPVLAVAFP